LKNRGNQLNGGRQIGEGSLPRELLEKEDKEGEGVSSFLNLNLEYKRSGKYKDKRREQWKIVFKR